MTGLTAPAQGAPAGGESAAGAVAGGGAQAAGAVGAGSAGVLPGQGVAKVPVDRIRPSDLQPRRDFPEESLRELADSIREQGILQPLVVRTRGEFLELIAGERRWRAAQLAGLKEVPVVLREADDTTALELMLVENLQREGLNPMDEAKGYSELLGRFALTQDAVATRVGRSRTAVANALRLLRLPEDVQALLRDGRLSTGHAKVILGLPTAELQSSTARRAVQEELSVRKVEELVSRLLPPSGPATPVAARPQAAVALRDPHVASMEDKLRQRLGTKVSLRYRQGRGQIDIRFFSDDELERVLAIVGVDLD